MPDRSTTFADTIRPLFQIPRSSWLAEEEMARHNRHLAEAIQHEKRDGHRIAIIARSAALVIVAIMLPLLNPHADVLYYEAFLLTFLILGWIQLRVARVGQSRLELALLLVDLLLMAVIMLVPNPFHPDTYPTAALFRFDIFQYYYLFLAAGTLAYSWRTVLTIGQAVAVIWLFGTILVVLFGTTEPQLSDEIRQVFAGRERIIPSFDPNDAEIGSRIQEVVLFLIISVILALKSMRSNSLLQRQAQLATERANLSRYFPPTMVDELAMRDEPMGPIRSQEVAVLFADIVGFTRFAESRPPQQVVDTLRQFHAILEGCVFANGGTLDKYLGDGIMATFGTPRTNDRDACNALAAARTMHVEVDRWNEKRAAARLEPIRLSVGINFGPVILGDIGTERRLEFAAIGDTVNVASRLEGATRQLDCRIIASRSLIERMRRENAPAAMFEDLREIRGLQIRGRVESLDVFVL